MKNRTLLVTVFALLVGLVSAAPVAAQLPGAIFTTDVNGTRVNQNIYDNKCDVYLDGGPGPNAPATAASLPDGDYFFQVTDPSGQVLLSTDPVANRQFTVEGGRIIASTHPTGTDSDQNALTVQLCPFNDTPNRGGVYKVWATPVGSFVGDPTLVDNGYTPGYFHGFIPASSKTDNFKVKHAGGHVACLTVTKFFDANGNGVLDRRGNDLEPALNWPVTVTDPNGALVGGQLFTPTTLCNLVPGSYTVTEADTDNPSFTYTVTANILDGVSLTPPSRTVIVTIDTSDRELIFGNACADGIPH